LLEWQQKDLAERAGVAPQTISGLEADTRTTSRAALKLIRAAIDDGGVEFFDAVEGVHGWGVRWKWGF
jgi:transcriptional regulator with XRE-family HTH domain